jgi:hypothetical protein
MAASKQKLHRHCRGLPTAEAGDIRAWGGEDELKAHQK